MPHGVTLMMLLVVVGLSLMASVIFLWLHFGDGRRKRHPLGRKLLRSPGESIRSRLDELRWDLSAFLAIGMLPLPLGMGLYFALWLHNGSVPGPVATACLVLMALGAQGWLAWRLWAALTQHRRLKLAYEAELAVGQELGELGRLGYRIFHDFPVEELRFNIDHIVVGSGGVFAVETKGRSKPASTSSYRSWEVESDGRVLKFPQWTDTETPRQAQAAADWLRSWLTSAVGEKVRVEPLVVVPGWYIRRTAQTGVPVIALKEIGRRIANSRSGPVLSEKLIRQIAHQLTERCRDVTPRAYAGRPGVAGKTAPNAA